MVKLNKDILYRITQTDNSIIIIDGITCAGKTTFSNLLKKIFKKKNKNAHLISKDLFLLPRNKRISVIKNFKNKYSLNQNLIHYDQKKLQKLFLHIKSKKNTKLIIKGLYDRNIGRNTKTEVFQFKKNNVIIFEGLYILEDLKKYFKVDLKILITNNVYKSLMQKIERIRDKKISIDNVVKEFTSIHLSSFKKYLLKYKFDYSLELDEKSFRMVKNGSINQVKKITQFINKHSH